MQNKNYNQTWGISQSSIKAWKFKSPLQWKKRYIDDNRDDDKDTESFTMGSLVDTLLFTPELLNDRFYKGKEKLPSEAIAWIVREYFATIIEKNKQIEENNKSLPVEEMYIPLDLTTPHENLLLKITDNCPDKDKDGSIKYGWQNNWKAETRIKHIVEKGSEYFEYIKAANGRKIISEQQNLQAIEIRDILVKDENVRDYFIPSENNELLFQLEIYSYYDFHDELSTDYYNITNVPIKGALDIVKINHKEKTVQIIDFKTSQSAYNFIDSIKHYGYDQQLSYYNFLLERHLRDNNIYKGYIFKNPINIVIDFTDKIPYIYEYTDEDMYYARYGTRELLTNIFTNFKIPIRVKQGWQNILDEICWHYVSNQWDKPKEMYLNKKIIVNLLSK